MKFLKKNFNFNNKFFNIKIFKYNQFYLKQKVLILKIILKLVYKFHILNKKILFILNANIFYLFLKKIKKHIFLINNFWVNGFFSNFKLFRYFSFYKKFSFNCSLKNNLHLIINLDNFFKNEIIKSKILSIFFYKTKIRQLYNLNSFNKIKLNLFFLLIYEIVKYDSF